MGFTCVVSPLTTEAVRLGGERWRITQAVPAMGTVVSMSVLDASRDRAEEAAGRAWEAMHRCIAVLNRFDAASAVSELNSAGRLKDAPDELLAVLRPARDLTSRTGGAFDPTVKPVVDLLHERRERGLSGPPAEHELRDALGRVGVARMRLRGRTVAFRGDGMGLTLDGIAKGYVVDAAAAALEHAGIAHYLVNAGGDIRTAGSRDGTAPWRVAVQDPDKADRFPAILAMGTGAVATSGSYEIYFDGERTCHHIVEAATGRSPGECVSVTVRAPTAMQADALATAVFVMGPAAGLRLIAATPGCESLVLTAGGRHRSAGWDRLQEESR